MKFKMDHTFYWPAETIIEPLKRGEDIVPMDRLPNVSMRKVLSQERKGDKLYSRVEWNVHGQIPKVAQKIIRPEMLTFVEESVWDDNEMSFTTKIVPHYLKDKVKCRTRSQYHIDGPTATRRRFQGELRILLPIINTVVEKAIIDHLKKNNDENAKMMCQILEERHGPPQKD